jgi:fructan beta-fructosidase
MNIFKGTLVACYILASLGANAQKPKLYHEPYRPQFHFSPAAKWMNDPNGMVYYKGTYHLFYQYYPKDIVWGPMHWGHATSKDLIHWKQQPIALYPDKLGYIFSGSAVMDINNTSGFGKNGKVPMVAIFTHHDPVGEKANTNNFQNQSIAYSLDEGKTWTKYAGNPVVKNPGIKDFRDPKVSWYAAQHKWVMTLATKDRITFYSSPNLKNWKKESEFGEKLGAHGGVWECPDLFPLKLDGKEYWILIVSIGSGAPNGGSGTQYFIGDFNGSSFAPLDDKTRWLDYGPDDYAGITWSNTGSRKIFLGWMANWQYANQVPTATWRSATTIPRDLALKRVGDDIYVTSAPVKELSGIAAKIINVPAEGLRNGRDIGSVIQLPSGYRLKFKMERPEDYFITLNNDAGETLVIGYNKKGNRYFINREKSGRINFNKEFAKWAFAPRIATKDASSVELLVDASSVELFADDGLSSLTSVYFASGPYNHLSILTAKGEIKDVKITPFGSIW